MKKTYFLEQESTIFHKSKQPFFLLLPPNPNAPNNERTIVLPAVRVMLFTMGSSKNPLSFLVVVFVCFFFRLLFFYFFSLFSSFI